VPEADIGIHRGMSASVHIWGARRTMILASLRQAEALLNKAKQTGFLAFFICLRNGRAFVPAILFRLA
jgi:hypothetical protein